MKVALFIFPQFSFMSPDVKTENEAKYTTQLRVSEWVDVDFTPRNAAELLAAKLDYIDARISEAKTEKNEQLARLEKLRSALEAELVLQS